MRVHQKESAGTAIPEADTIELQPHNTTGYETCQPIEAIKEELARLMTEMSKYSHLALVEKDRIKSGEYYLKSNKAAIRYWAVRWVMGWEKEIPYV